MSTDKNRTKTRIAVYLIGMRDHSILLGKRINAQHMNNHWSLPAGHVMESESIIDAIIRECSEEIGISLCKSDLHLVGSLHQFSDPYDYANYIFKVDLSPYNPVNSEPEKCESLDFFDINNLPEPMAPYIKFIIDNSTKTDLPWIKEIGF